MTAKETLMYRTVFWTLGEGEDGMIWENGIKTCIISYKKRIASPGLMQDTGFLGLVHWDDPEGWYNTNLIFFQADSAKSPFNSLAN